MALLRIQALRRSAKLRSAPTDLVGGPFAVIESDPAGVFSSLVRKLGIRGLEVVEIYDIEPWATQNLSPYGLIFCFLWRKDTHHPAHFQDPAAEQVWFANQLCENACASFAILNVLLNCPNCELGQHLSEFKAETAQISCISRPADVRGALNAIATSTLEKIKKESSTVPPAKRKKTTPVPIPEDVEETYHFIGYVPAHGKVWELDGLKLGPIEVGELPGVAQDSSSEDRLGSWMDVVRPALRMKMKKYSGAGDGAGDIRFNLLAIVDDSYQVASDKLELLKREKSAIERRLSDYAFATSIRPALPGSAYTPDFGSRMLEKQKAILHLPSEELIATWENCVESALRAKVAVEHEIAKAIDAETDHTARVHDYEPFIEAFISQLSHEGRLNQLLRRGENRPPIKASKAS
ncbi:ubiquitin C-terminal hydrolase [Artomyces pyxidatus]|uniref:Ubiquitin C-terminal hydrolase n=1 Tax=Artomyces pyxidatus TaxID=48021 RepID=A0ACB8ST24_9AGAM|nr:ubiquitin C-terminal hydrolase [Artomyces pyxidatus]